ncbi:MAG: c-type cytochrome domain-containing protein, partial [Rubripirellula sp.]
MRDLFAALARLTAFALMVCSGLPAAEWTPQQVEFFEAKVRPILVDNCYECHSVEAEDVEAGLVLDSKWGWETGGDSGAAIIPGNLDESLLIDAVRYDENIVSGMPPRSKLPAEQIKVLEQWVEMGAPDPRPKAVRADGSKRET